MRTTFVLALAGLMAVTVPASAGTLTFSEGQATWQSTACKEPAAPVLSVVTAHHETRADKMNVLMKQYNEYALQMQTYMDCVSNEAQKDSAAVNQAISSTSQGLIDSAQQKVNAAGGGLAQKKG